jgi:hypothetical protein
MARNSLLMPAAQSFLYLQRTLSAFLVAHLGASMAAHFMTARAGFPTFHAVVRVRMAKFGALMTAVEALSAGLSATTFGRMLGEIRRTGHLCNLGWVLAALQSQTFSYRFNMAELFHNSAPKRRRSGQKVGIPNKIEAVFRAREGNAHAVRGLQKTDRIDVVASDKR